MRSSRLMIAGAIATSVVLGVSGTAIADRGHNSRTIRVLDDCDPVTFNAALGDGACQGDGDTTVDEVMAQLLKGKAPRGWANKPRKTHIKAGQGLHVVNRGGELHTFTEVMKFGAGCVPELNEPFGLTDPPSDAECGAAFAAALPSGAATDIAAMDLTVGVHRFQCMIHPWMHTTVKVRHR